MKNKELFYLHSLYNTYFGEVVGLPLLDIIINNSATPPEVKSLLEAQYKEEQTHVKMYSSLVDTDLYHDTFLGSDILSLVKDLKKPTLQLFTTQVLLEGLALGSLKFRLDNYSDGFAKKIDTLVMQDEAKHNFSIIDTIADLKESDGLIKKPQFLEIESNFYKILKRPLSLREIKKFHSIVNPSEDFNLDDFLTTSGYQSLVKSHKYFLERGVQLFYNSYFKEKID